MAMVEAAAHSTLAAPASPSEMSVRWADLDSDEEDVPSKASKVPARRSVLGQKLLRSCVVKNTFVEPPSEHLEQVGLQRSSSEPTLFSPKEEERPAIAGNGKKPRASPGSADEEASTDDTGASAEASEEEGAETSSASSTAEGAAAGTPVVGEDWEHEGADIDDTPRCGALARALKAAAAVHDELEAMGAEEHKNCQAASLAQADDLLEFLCGTAPPPPAPAPASAAAATPAMRLRAVAKPWRPSDAFAGQTQRVTAAVLAHIKSLPMTHEASMVNNTRGWTIQVSVLEEDLFGVECLFSNAKAALMSAAQLEGNVQLLGSCKDPFYVRPMCFSARLGFMENQAMACWDAFASGRCHRHNCRWEHPARWDFFTVAVAAVARDA